MKIKISRIKKFERKISQCRINFMKKAIQRHDPTIPILVKKLKNGWYKLIDGGARILAYKELGRTEIEAHECTRIED